MTPLLMAEGLTISGRLHPTSFSAAPGSLICLVGPNGSGKTSLLHAIARVGTAAGSVRVNGKDPAALSPDQRQRLVGFLPASRELKWPLKASDVVALGLPARANVQVANEALELDALLDRTVDQLSTGERSRVLIARALAAEPTLLLLDEPTANLDPLWQLKLLDLLRTISRAEQRAIVIAIHDLDLAARYADRLVVMHAGRIAADGDPQTLLDGSVIQDVFGIRRGKAGWIPA